MWTLTSGIRLGINPHRIYLIWYCHSVELDDFQLLKGGKLVVKRLKIKFLAQENVKGIDRMTITAWASTHQRPLLVGDFRWHLFGHKLALNLKLRLPRLALSALTLFDLAVLSIRALRFNNARNSPGTCSYVPLLISSLGPAVGSCTVESALTFLKQCVKEVGWVAGSRVGLRGENNNLAWNSMYPQQRIECVKDERTLSLSLFPQPTSLPSLKNKISQLYLEVNVINSSVYKVSGRTLRK